MHSHSTRVLLDLPELNVCHIQKEQDHILLEVTPIHHTQPYSICASAQTIRRGTAKSTPPHCVWKACVFTPTCNPFNVQGLPRSFCLALRLCCVEKELYQGI